MNSHYIERNPKKDTLEMYISSLIFTILYWIFPIVAASEECDAALKSAYAELSSGAVKSLAVPAVCEDSLNVVNEITSIHQARTAEKTYCSYIFNSYQITMTSYSYDDSITDIGNFFVGGNDVAQIFSNNTNANNCGSGLVFMGTSPTEGFDMFVQSYDSTKDSCDAQDNETLLEAVVESFGTWLYVQHRTSFCIVVQPVGSTWRGTIRGLYSNETSFTSPANIPCVLESGGFEMVSCRLF